mgnify:CR=1 FL=1
MGATPAGIKTRTFPQGGIHPPDLKLSADRAIVPAPVPSQVALLLGQHIGAPAKPVVGPGDKVLVGQMVAEASGFVSSPVHSSVSGTVLRLDDVPDVSGYRRPAIIVKVEGDEWMSSIDRSPGLCEEITASPQEIVEAIKTSGIVGLGGATFPTHVKLSVGPGKNPPEHLLINGVECEPYLTADHRLMIEKAPEIVTGVRLLMAATGVRRAMIGIEVNKMDAVRSLQEAASRYPAIEVVPLQMHYPQGGERQLVKALIGREIPPPPQGLPIDVGAVVINVATVFAVYEAVQKKKPLIERVVTFTGKAFFSGGNFLVRLGTSVADLFSSVGGVPEDIGKIVCGGPMMGRAFADLDIPMTKGMSGLVLFSRAEARQGEITNCIRCGKCVAVCPLGLEPYLVAGLVERGDLERAEKERAVSCCECGCCDYICPANRPLLDYLKIGKARIMEAMKRRAKG